MQQTRNEYVPKSVSVILPVYNVEPWIGDCIDSLKRQQLPGLEFIFVDDCGSDQSMKYVEEWAGADDRVHIIRHEKNRGAGASRNSGIERAQGEYLSFVDPDDRLSEDFYVKLYRKAKTSGQDIIKGRRFRIDEQNRILNSESDELSRKTNRRIQERTLKKAPLYTCFTNEFTSAIYSSSLFYDNNLRYGNTAYSEDVTFLLKLCHDTESIALVDDAIYFYREHSASATSVFTIRRSMEELKSLEESVDFFEGKNESDWKYYYLKARIKARLTNYYYAVQDNNIPAEQQYAYVDRFRKLIDRLNHHPLLYRDNTELEAFLKTGQAAPQRIKISVIIPLYKCADFMDDLLNSVCDQSLRDTEIICVLDGEDKDIRKAIENRSKTDSRIKCLEQAHAGAGAARNTGMAKARGDYLLFLDADDLFERHMFEKMYAEAAKWNADTVMCSYTESDEWNQTVQNHKGFNHVLLRENCVFDPATMPQILTAYVGAAWNKLFRRKMVEKHGLQFSDTRIMNDEFFVSTAILCSERLVTIHEDLLTVRRYINQYSISSNRAKYTQDFVLVMNQIYQWLKDNNKWAYHREAYYNKFSKALRYQFKYDYNEQFVEAIARMLSMEEPWKRMPNATILSILDMNGIQAKKTKLQLEVERASMAGGETAGLENQIHMADNQIYTAEQIRLLMKYKYGKDLMRTDSLVKRLVWSVKQNGWVKTAK